MNGGSCSFNPDSGPSCTCSIGFSGQRCEVGNPRLTFDSSPGSSSIVNCSDLNACSNGQCQTGPPDHCICNDGFHLNNSKCLPKSPCDYKPCLHGDCVFVSDETSPSRMDFICNCFPGWNGTFCEINTHGCSTYKECKNGGTCFYMNGTLPGRYGVCLCPEGFNGSFCDTAIDPCANNRCVNGTCTGYHNDSYYCECNSGNLDGINLS